MTWCEKFPFVASGLHKGQCPMIEAGLVWASLKAYCCVPSVTRGQRAEPARLSLSGSEWQAPLPSSPAHDPDHHRWEGVTPLRTKFLSWPSEDQAQHVCSFFSLHLYFKNPNCCTFPAACQILQFVALWQINLSKTQMLASLGNQTHNLKADSWSREGFYSVTAVGHTCYKTGKDNGKQRARLITI